MGGDDLGSDDEYLIVPSAETYEYIKDGSDSEKEDKQKDSKRRLTTTDDSEDQSIKPHQEERKKSKKSRRPIRVLGTRIRLESPESKSEILSELAGTDFRSVHIAKIKKSNEGEDNNDGNNLKDQLLCLISKKQLKIKQQQKSPRAIILCLSARRCVAVLKDLAPLKLKILKLFPKNGSVSQHGQQLQTACAIAVGTPQRITDLISKGYLSLTNTQLIGLDTFQNQKSFSVYTLPDTTLFVETLLRQFVFPACCSGRKELKVGFV
mgnify:FL=1